MSLEEKRAYNRGYSRGRNNHWPEHRPPLPPSPVIAGLMTALRELRDEADSICAALSEDDEFVIRLGPRVDAADAALAAVTAWLEQGEQS